MFSYHRYYVAFNFLESYSPMELSSMMKIYTSYKDILSTWNVTIMSEGLNFYFFSVSVNVSSCIKLINEDTGLHNCRQYWCKSEDLLGHPYLYVWNT